MKLFIINALVSWLKVKIFCLIHHTTIATVQLLQFFLYALVHPFSCWLKSARQKWEGAVTPLPQICERAGEWGNVGTRPHPASAVRKHPLVGEVRPADRWATFDPACRRVLLYTPGMCLHLSANHVTARGRGSGGEHSPPKPKQLVCAHPGLCVMVYILWLHVNVGESVLGAGVMDELIWRDTRSGVCEKGGRAIRIFSVHFM